MPETTIGSVGLRRALVVSDPQAQSGAAGFDQGGVASEVRAEITGGFSMDTPIPTYSVSTGLITPAATPTDIFTISASTKTVRVTMVRVSGIASTAASLEVSLMKRSTLDTAGTLAGTQPNIVAHWGGTVASPNAGLAASGTLSTADPASTAVVKLYSANPTLGINIGAVRDDALFLAGGTSFGIPIEWDFFNAGRALILPAGSTHLLAVNGLGAALGAGTKLAITIQWSEDN